MSYELGAFKYLIGMLTSVWGFVSLYIFGDGIWNTIEHAQALVTILSHPDEPMRLLRGLFEIYVPTPGSFIESLIVFPLVGGIVATVLWYIAVK